MTSLHFKPTAVVFASIALRGYESVLLATPLPLLSRRRRRHRRACRRVSDASLSVDATRTCLKTPAAYQTILPVVGDTLDRFILRRLDGCHFIELRGRKFLLRLSKMWRVCLANKYIAFGESYWEGVDRLHSWLLQSLPAGLLGVVKVGSSVLPEIRTSREVPLPPR